MEDKNLRVGSLVLSIVIFILLILGTPQLAKNGIALNDMEMAVVVIYAVFMLLGIYYGAAVYVKAGVELKALLFYGLGLWTLLTFTAGNLIINPLTNAFFLAAFLLIALQSYILLTLHEQDKS